MNRLLATIVSLTLGIAAVAACAPSTEDAESQDGNLTEAEEYDFQIPKPGEKLERVDALGVALISTVLMNRDRTPTGEDNKNQYQIDTPDVQNNPKTLKGFIHYLRALHSYWHDQLEDTGFEPCSKKIGNVTLAVPCTVQPLRFDEDIRKEGPRVIDVVLPDYIALDFDEPNRFPNGRTPWEPISDKVFAMGFLKMGGRCPGIDTMPGVPDAAKKRVQRDASGTPICTVETLADVQLQVPTNDRPFFPDAFPYLARPWFYPQPAAGTPYFWPSAARLEVPE